ncbi:MBL fold metallo-hydrolase [Methylobacterium oryzisoli]|uniref:MBL fold metallo-hydrolase n=1 Tax=Methylobacterium oryzisoli TaxID=3385502 RepID=UPI0038927C99
MPHAVTRRTLIAAAGLLPLAARATESGPVPDAGPVQVGSWRIEPLRDGLFPLEPAMIPGADSEAGRTLLRQAGLPPAGPTPEPVNAFLIRRGDRHWLLDAGCGGVFGPDFGRATAGLDAGRIDGVWLTHLHADHAGGLLAPDGTARFPRAELVVQEAEAAYWSDPASRARAPAAMGPFFDTALAVLRAYAGRVRRVSGAADLAPGVVAVPLPGHTPGHAGVLIEENGARLLIWGDIVHSRLLQMPHPDWTVIWDADPAQAAATRRRILDRAVVEGLPVTGMHLAGVGRVARDGAAYAFVA